MNSELKRDITELLRGDNRNWDQMDKVLSQITEEQFVQLGLVDIFNQIAKQYRMSQGAVSNAQKYPWVNKYINLDNYGRTTYRHFQPLTIPELLVNIQVHKYKDITNILEDTLFKLYIKGKVELAPHVEDLVTILDSISVKERKGVYASLTSGIQQHIGRYERRRGVIDKKITYIQGTESYKHIIKLIGESLDRNASGPLSGADIIVDYYYQEYPHFIGWKVTLNTIIKDIMELGFTEGIEKHKLTKSQSLVITGRKFTNDLNGGGQFLLDDELFKQWTEFIKLNGGSSGVYKIIRDIEDGVKAKKANRESKGKKERSVGVGIDMVTPSYRVVRINYTSKAKIVNYVKLHDVLKFVYAYNGEFKLVINGVESELRLTETELHNSFNIRTNTKCIYDLEEIK